MKYLNSIGIISIISFVHIVFLSSHIGQLSSINFDTTISDVNLGKSSLDLIQFENDQLILDIRNAKWFYVLDTVVDNLEPSHRMFGGANVNVEQIKEIRKKIALSEKWRPIKVGHRWEPMGYPELNNQNVWLRMKFYVPDEMKGYKIGFFCSAIDDGADFFLNGNYIDRVKYVWGARIPNPTNIDLTSFIEYGAENQIMIRVSDYSPSRGGGIVGSVLLYRTLPFEKTLKGGINIIGEIDDAPLSVVLKQGDALLSENKNIEFSQEQLYKLRLPQYVLRDDELILVCSSKTLENNIPKYRVEINNLNSTCDNKPLSIDIGEFQNSIGLFDLMKVPIKLNATFDNPFDPNEIKVVGEITTPSGIVQQVSAFFKQDYERITLNTEEEILLPRAGSPWVLYYRPMEKGVFKFHLIAEDCTGIVRTEDQGFTVTSSPNKGFLRVSEKDPSFFEFDNGESYFGIGPSGWFRNQDYIFGGNSRWISTRLMDEYYKIKASSGSNFDYFLAEFFGRLYTEGGYIDQQVAWNIEHRLRVIEDLGIYWVTCVDDIRRSDVYGFNTLPYSFDLGGPAKVESQVYFNEKSLAMQKNGLRYFVSRNSDSPAILVWAVGDESQEGTKFSKTMVQNWVKELQSYIKSIDIYHHPHVVGEGPGSVANGGDAIIVPDWYFNPGLTTDGVELVLNIMKQYNEFNVPVINPEGGMVQWTKPADKLGPVTPGYYLTGERWKFPEAISFHNNLWISLFTKSAVGGTEWLGQFIVSRGELYHATAIKNFLKGETLTGNFWAIAKSKVTDSRLRSFSLKTEGKTLIWIQNKSYTWVEAGHYGIEPPAIINSTLLFPVNEDGLYKIEFWDTRLGNITKTLKTFSKNGSVGIQLPPINKDIAIKAILES